MIVLAIYNIALMSSNSHSRISRGLERVLLKSVLGAISSNDDWSSWCNQLARISLWSFNRQSKERRPKCIACGKVYDNYLLLVLHLELFHNEEIEIASYQITSQTITALTRPQSLMGLHRLKAFIVNDSEKSFTVVWSLKDRTISILTSIFTKFSKKQMPVKMQHFHSLDVFKEIKQGQLEDSDEELGQIELDLERMRITDFTDINETDKHFFITWNQAMYAAKRGSEFLSEQDLRELLHSFAKTAKKKNFKRISMLIHSWTLFSVGKISSQDVTNFLNVFDTAEA